MLAQQNRFHGSRAVRRLYKDGKTARTRLLSLKYKTASGQPLRLAIVVSRKVHKSAVVRNRIRRRLYECVRKDFMTQLREVEAVVTVFDAQVAVVTQKELHAELRALLSKAHLLSGVSPSRAIVNTNSQSAHGAQRGR